jgi:uncharacterized protein YukE
MAASNIKANIEEMMSLARSISGNADTLYQRQENVRKIIGNMGRCFSGKLPSLMLQNSLNVFTKARAMKDNLKNYYADFLQHAAERIESDDRALAGEMKNAAGGNAAPVSDGTPGTSDSGRSVLDIAKKYLGQYNPDPNGEQCKGFIKHIFREMYGKDVVPSGIGTEWKDNGYFQQVGDSLLVNGTPSQEQMLNFMQNLSPGDALQMQWKYGTHTMIIDSIQRDASGNITGINIIDANYDGNNTVRKEPYLYTVEAFCNEFNGSGQGVTAYRYKG